MQQQIAYAEETLALQKTSLTIATAKFKGGQVSEIDVTRAQSDVATPRHLIEQFRIPLRQATNRLCVLLGMPPEDLTRKLGQAPIPRRRRKWRSASPPTCFAAAPTFAAPNASGRRPMRTDRRRHRPSSIRTSPSSAPFGWSAQQIKGLFAGDAFRGTVGPTFTWNILQYGRLVSNIRAQDAEFQALVVNYQNTVLNAGKDVEDGLVTFLRAQKRANKEQKAVAAEMAAFKQAIDQYKGGLVDYNRVVLIQERLVERQQTLAEAQGQIAQGLIQVYRALGGGWQIRCNPAAAVADESRNSGPGSGPSRRADDGER